MLIDLVELCEHGWLYPEELQPDPALNDHRVDFSAVSAYRMARLHLAGSRFVADNFPGYIAFCEAEKSWLDEYALFIALAERYEWQDWNDWPAPFASRVKLALDKAAAELADEIAFWKFCQWNFFRQWRNLKSYANARGVHIIGDMPIFIAFQSVDVWVRQELFELGPDRIPTVVAGVPPDYFSETGQRWGNPLYRWDAHEAEGYAWWVERLYKTMQLVDVVRIDHFRGFAAYWEIPATEMTAIQGRWVNGPGEKLFAAMQAALGDLLVIAEDLGVITPDVTALREQFALPGMRVLQFAFGDNDSNPHLPHNFDHNLVVYGGTHDNDTAVGWFETASEHERAFACQYMQTDGHEIHWDLIRTSAQSPADIAIFPFQDILGLGNEARMNRPGTFEGNWSWRFNWQQVLPGYAEKLAAISAQHGRAKPERV
jgi:4-alpha-glucanotransferase